MQQRLFSFESLFVFDHLVQNLLESHLSLQQLDDPIEKTDYLDLLRLEKGKESLGAVKVVDETQRGRLSQQDQSPEQGQQLLKTTLKPTHPLHLVAYFLGKNLEDYFLAHIELGEIR